MTYPLPVWFEDTIGHGMGFDYYWDDITDEDEDTFDVDNDNDEAIPLGNKKKNKVVANVDKIMLRI